MAIITQPKTISREELQTLAKVTNDVFFFSTFCYVIHPVRGKVQFALYPFQKAVLYQFVKERFNIVLKFRQAGITELISMYCLWLCMYHPNKKVNIISIKDTTAKKVLKKIKFMYKNLPWYLQTPIINGRASELGSTSLMEFANGSFIESVPTSPEAGRSESLTLLVIDEAAMVRWANEVWAAALPTLATGGNAIINSCITGDTEIIGRHGNFRVEQVCPKEFGVQDISFMNIEVLTHKLQWRKALYGVNKGILETWEIENNHGDIIKCTPAHKFLTPKGWLPASKCIEHHIPVIRYDSGESALDEIPKTEPPKVEVIKPIPGFPNYEVSNLQILTVADNTQRAVRLSRNLKLNTNTGKGAPDLQLVGYIRWLFAKGRSYSYIIGKVESNFGLNINRAYVTRVVKNLRCKRVELSYLKCKRVFSENIYDITVEGDESYITTSNYVSHNTPKGIGNFYHSQWVDAISGGNGFNPIRLYWEMHPERDEKWYYTMSKALGPRRTAQEIDGDFLSSGNTVFDLADIKAIEDCLSDFPVIKTRFNGQYRQFLEPVAEGQYYIGADVATGRSNDYSSFTCMDRFGEEQVVYKGRISVDKYARLLGDTGELFNYALLAPESNDVGLAVTSMLQTEGYPNLYYYQKLIKQKGKSRPEVDKVPGWLTTNKNRSVIIEALEKDIREGNITIKDPFFVNEAYTFIYDGLNRPVAMGKHKANTNADDPDAEVYADDDIFGKAITNHIRKGKNQVIVLPK